MPSQNAGIETRIEVKSVTKMSQNEYLLMAEIMPAPMPTMASMMMATMASRTVFGYFDANICVTGMRRWYEVPRSPWSRLTM